MTIGGEKKVLWLYIGDGGMEMKIERERAELLGKHDFRNQQIALSERRGKVFRKFLAERGGW